MTSLSSAQRRALGALLQASPFAKVARELGERFTDAGHQLYLVGGTVRDALLERSSPDVDFTTDADPTRILEIVKAGGWDDGVWLQGARFGTVGVRKGTLRLEITTFRSDVYHEDSRKPEVTFGRSVEEDLARRDFTVNAMAVRLPDGRFIDPFGGLTDLANRRLRTPSSPATSFEDDPLRMLRAARFVAQLELVPTQETVEAITERVGRLEIVSRERIRDELEKLLRGRAPARHRQAAHPPGGARWRVVPPARGGRRQDGRAPAPGAALLLRGGPGRPHPGAAAPAVPHLPARLDRLGGAAVRARRRGPAGPAELPGPLGLHHPQPLQGQAARGRLRRAGGADRQAGGRGGAGQDQAAAQRRRGHGVARRPSRPDRRQGPEPPAGAAAGPWAHVHPGRHRGAARLGPRPGPGAPRPRRAALRPDL